MKVPWSDSHPFEPCWFDRKQCKNCHFSRDQHSGAEPQGTFEIWRDLWFGGWENKLYFAGAVYFGVYLVTHHATMTRGELALMGYWFGTSLTMWAKAK